MFKSGPFLNFEGLEPVPREGISRHFKWKVEFFTFYHETPINAVNERLNLKLKVHLFE